MAIEVIKTELSDVVLFNTVTKVTFVIPLNELNKVKDKLDAIHYHPVPRTYPSSDELLTRETLEHEAKDFSTAERRARPGIISNSS